VNDVLFSKNQSDFVAGAYSDGLVRLFDLKSYKLRSTFRNKAISTQPYNSITVNAANKWLAASQPKGLISLFRTQTNIDEPSGKHITETASFVCDSPCNQIQFSCQDQKLLGAACDLSVSLYNCEKMKLEHHFTREHKGKVMSLAFSPLN